MRATSLHPLPLLALLALAVLAGACASVGAPASRSAPNGPWTPWSSAAAAGYDAETLEAARRHADEAHSGAVMVVEDGRVVAAWGDVERKLEQDGVWNGRRVLPEGWVKRASAPASELGHPQKGQGYAMM